MTILSVSQLNRYVSSLLDADPNLSTVQVTGEISSFRRYPSGHLYFTLKDASCTVSCVMFRSSAASLRFEPQDGVQVVVEARASLYDRDGKFQLYISGMKPDGIGDLYAAFDVLKQKLQAEGLFNPDRKKPIPYLPKRIGVATSSSGAVIRDILQVLGRRFPGFDLLLIPVKVQGEGAAASIASAIETFNRRDDIDVIIIGRGGGSMEDLWCFNDEKLARTIAASRIPVISAVGHETDFTIADFAADLRAPTPSAAAELVLPIRQELDDRINGWTASLTRSLDRNLAYAKLRLHNAADCASLTDPDRLLQPRKERLAALEERLVGASAFILRDRKIMVANLSRQLDSLSPLKVLSRGYGIIEQPERGQRIVCVDAVSAGDHLKVIVSDGTIHCQVHSTERRSVTIDEG
jgi:exodeoxyribonuclease VII large subunit